MIEVHEPTYQQRRAMEAASIPFEQRWGPVGCYLAAWIEARKRGRKLSVADACEQAGFSPDALRQRRKHNADFRAAELTARRGQPYVAPQPVVAEAQHVVPDPTVTDTTFRPPPAPIVEVEHGRPVGPDDPTNTTLATPPAPPRKRKPTRRHTPMWVPGSGYEHY